MQYEARRKEECERVEQELKSLREKQERRRREREQEEKELAEKMRLAEEKHRQEEVGLIFIHLPFNNERLRISFTSRK